MAELIGATLQRKGLYRRNANANDVSSIEATEEIPKVIDDLIDNKMFRNKFKALIRRGHLQDLLDLAAVAPTKEKPSRWFATVTAKKNWERTLDFLKKLRKVERVVQEVQRRIQVPARNVAAVFKAAWLHQDSTVRLAIDASEKATTSPFRYFCKTALGKTAATTTA
ncbi:hypothetical protein QWJ26_26540 [Streptomyces sp. CSDS2]|uniref:hypothetical protein n=1 Tax=Streptomyces sp. CSDS2 TaxID=3055051 RepID=UPI0025AF1B7B|nr:hypothetical protein [Streptomyces sp. CSDS2]MDN3263304.1 hypothetical protein [Streptomyces sp. CSDS2]